MVLFGSIAGDYLNAGFAAIGFITLRLFRIQFTQYIKYIALEGLHMTREQLIRNMMLILSDEEMHRVTIRELENGLVYIDVDLHGQTRKQAEKFIKNIINVNRGEFTLNVIHGFHHGTVLKEMIMETKWSSRVVDRSCPVWNPGQTILKIAA